MCVCVFATLPLKVAPLNALPVYLQIELSVPHDATVECVGLPLRVRTGTPPPGLVPLGFEVLKLVFVFLHVWCVCGSTHNGSFG